MTGKRPVGPYDYGFRRKWINTLEAENDSTADVLTTEDGDVLIFEEDGADVWIEVT